MRSIEIQTANTYTVLIGQKLLPQTGALLRGRVQPCRCLLIADDTVNALYGATVTDSLTRAGFTVSGHSLPAGEAGKSMGELARLLETLAAGGLNRGDIVVALGGGATGDLAGLAAALYLRGIGYAQIPTTLLAAVDASVGGKTAVNLSLGKNLAGAFHQPLMVICDCDSFATLPQDIWRAGLGECVKYGMLGSAALLRSLADGSYAEDIPALVSSCVELKASIIAADEREEGGRRLLNFGHTVAHAIEVCSGFSIAHGLAVASGMAVITRAAVKRGLCPNTCLAALSEALTACGLPQTTNFSAHRLAQAARQDKKRCGEHITIVLPHELGSCALYDLPLAELAGFIADGLEQ